MKDNLMEKAISLWQEYGYDNVSINRICRECGVTKGSFYFHFASKEDLLLRYIKKMIDQVELNEDLYQNDSCIRGIYNVLMKVTEPLMKLNRSVMKVGYYNQIFSAHSDNFKNSEHYQICLDLCKKGQETGEIRDTFPAGLLLDTAIIFLNGNYRDWLLKDGGFDLLEEDCKALEIILKK